MPRSRRRRAGRSVAIAIVIVTAVMGVIAAIAVPHYLNRYGDEVFSRSRCTVTVDGQEHTLTGEQADNAALISAVSVNRGLRARAASIALATAIQESGLRNLDYGDRDSLGLFQQRPSQGWGSADEVRDRHHASASFYKALVRVDGWEEMEITVAAQAVQRSAFPDAYADHEQEARLWASALTGNSGLTAVACRIPEGEGLPEAGRALAARMAEDFGEDRLDITLGTPAPGLASVTAGRDGSDRYRNAVAAWSVAVSAAYPVESVGWCDREWRRDTGEWGPSPDGAEAPGCADNAVTVVLKTD